MKAQLITNLNQIAKVSILALFIAMSYFSPLVIPYVSANFNIGQKAVEKDIPYATTHTANPDNYKQNFAGLIGSLLSVVMAIAAVLLLLMLVWGGLEWVASGGDKSKLENARSRIFQAVIGMLVLAAATAIFALVQQILGICVLNFGPYSC